MDAEKKAAACIAATVIDAERPMSKSRANLRSSTRQQQQRRRRRAAPLSLPLCAPAVAKLASPAALHAPHSSCLEPCPQQFLRTAK